ncbi:MAG: response regulator [Thermoflavifilum aggregans]|nr:response regulator [Thermoflavifilum aggregans]
MAKILVVDDHPEILDNISEILSLAGHQVVTAASGKEAVEKALHQQPELIICDIMMPDLDGYGVLHVLKKNPQTAVIPFIFLTAKTERADFRKGMELGADDYITKPFDDTELLAAVDTRLNKVNWLKQYYGQAQGNVSHFLHDLQSRSEKDIFPPSVCESVSFPKQKIIYQEGERAKYLYLIQSGRVKITRLHPDGKEYISDIFTQGDYFGYVALIEDQPYRETAIALENTELLLIPKEHFLQQIFQDHQVTLTFIRLLSRTIDQKEERLLQLAYSSLRKRVAAALVEICTRNAASGNEHIPITREELAQYIGTAKESTIRILSDFRDEGLIQIRTGKIYIPDLNKLKDLRY